MRMTCLLLLGLLAVSCRCEDIRTVTIQVPGMKSPRCIERVVDAVARQQGVQRDKIIPDPVARNVVVTYDSMQLAVKNIEHAIADTGFQANEIPANESAREALPEECR